MIFIVEADDKYILDEKIKELSEKYLGKKGEFNYFSFDISETQISEITGTFMSNSLFDEKKMVIINDALFLSKKREKKKYIDEENIPDLFLLLEKMSNENIVIFPLLDCSLNPKNEYLEKQKYEYIICDKIGHDYKEDSEYLKIYDKYAKKICSDLKVSIEPNAYELLKTYWFPLYEFKNEITKLSLYKDVIDLESLKKLTSPPLGQSIFELTNFLFKGKKEEALKIFNDLILNNTEVIQILNTCASLIHFLYLVKYLLDKGFHAFEIADRLDENAGRIKKNIPIANESTLEGIRKVLIKLGDLDYEIKKGQITDPVFAFSNFILDFSLK